MTDCYSVKLLEAYENDVYPIVYNEDGTIQSGGYSCDGTVMILPSDSVCTGLLSMVANGVLQPPMLIKNIPYTDQDKMHLYLQYILNDTVKQLTAENQAQIGQIVNG